MYKSYQALLRWIPSICQVPQTDLKGILQQVGLSFSLITLCSSKFSSEKEWTVGAMRTPTHSKSWWSIGSWKAPRSQIPPSLSATRVEEGFTMTPQASFCVQSTTTGTISHKYACLFVYQTWLSLWCSHRQNIRDFHPNFPVNALSWLTFLYANGQFDPEDPAKGLFKGAWLVRVGLALEHT